MHRATGLIDRPIAAVLLLFVLSCSAAPLGAAGSCDWLGHYDHPSNVSMVLLDQMGGEMTEDRCPVTFPISLYEKMRNVSEVESRIRFIRDSLVLLSRLYDNGDPSTVAAWDAGKMEEFLIIVHRQADELKSCVSVQKLNRKLRRYYRKLYKNVLLNMGYSRASWELIRKESKHHLQQLHLLFATLTPHTRH